MYIIVYVHIKLSDISIKSRLITCLLVSLYKLYRLTGKESKSIFPCRQFCCPLLPTSRRLPDQANDDKRWHSPSSTRDNNKNT